MLKVGSVFRTLIRKMSGENKLGTELSPYLRQHKDNPVHWYPWGQEAIQRARSENKMIFLSIGYSTCHWCHVMERESFENDQVAAVMNEHYINIKVDREERPDVDKVYMTFVQATTGGGGWPLSLFLSPDLNPVYGGTYFPPRGNYGRPGFTNILQTLAAQWADNKEDMIESGVEVMKIIDTKLGAGSTHPGPLPQPAILQKFFAQLSKSYDSEFGGYSKAPKFPQPSNILTMFKLASWPDEAEDRRKRELEMNLHTLVMMDKGGIHDHISKGFARYSTDAKWHVPHFEKMLYDQAQLAVVYSIAFKLTGLACHKATVEDILSYVSRDLTHTLGGFFTAEDADSYPTATSTEKKEGAFCVWTHQEIKQLLHENIQGSELSLGDVLIHEFNVEEEGNVSARQDPHGELVNQNVFTKIPAKELPLSEEVYLAALEKGRNILFEHRLTRPRPSLDDKILCSSNGLMISGFCSAGSALDRPDYIQTAVKAANFIKQHMFDHENNQLLRSVYGGKPELEQLEHPIHGFIDDYAFTIQGMLDLYTATFETKWLKFALKLQEIQDCKFLDREKGGYYATEAGDQEIVVRLKDDHDGAEPSSNSISALNLLRLHKLTNTSTFKSKAEDILKLFHVRLGQAPVSMPAMVDAFLFHLQDGPFLVFNADEISFVSEVRQHFFPFVTLVGLEKNVDNIINCNPHLEGLNIAPNTGVLVQSSGEQHPVESIDQLKGLLMQE